MASAIVQLCNVLEQLAIGVFLKISIHGLILEVPSELILLRGFAAVNGYCAAGPRLLVIGYCAALPRLIVICYSLFGHFVLRDSLLEVAPYGWCLTLRFKTEFQYLYNRSIF